MKIGKKLKSLRKERKLTLKEISQKSGVQIATLSRMENDIMIGTLESHINICKALGVSLSDFYRDVETEQKTISVLKQKDKLDSLVHAKKASLEMLTTKIADKKMLPLIINIQKNGKTHKEEGAVGVEKFIYILEGKIRAIIEKETYNLTKGDSVYFEASLAHEFHNIGKSEARLLSVTSPPST